MALRPSNPKLTPRLFTSVRNITVCDQRHSHIAVCHLGSSQAHRPHVPLFHNLGDIQLTSKIHFSTATKMLGVTGIIALSACTDLGPGSGNLTQGSAPDVTPAPVVKAPAVTAPSPAPFVRKKRVNPLEASDDDNSSSSGGGGGGGNSWTG